MRLFQSRVKIIVVAFTFLALVAFSYTQYRAYRYDIKTTREQLTLNTLHGRIVYLDEALTLSARSFIMTRDSLWLQRYGQQQQEFYKAMMQIYAMVPRAFNGKAELDASIAGLMRLEAEAFRLARDNRYEQAKDVLFSPAYNGFEAEYTIGQNKLISHIQARMEALMRLHHSEAQKTAAAEAVVMLLLILGWYFVVRISRKWQRRINELNTARAQEAIVAAQQLERMNVQLRQLSAHLQDVRENERLSVANEINEEVGQQLAAVRLLLAEVQRALHPNGTAQAVKLQKASEQIYDVLNFLRKLTADIYPLVLRDLGVVEALDWESQRLNSVHINVAFVSEVEHIDVDIKTATTLFRAFQEKVQSMLQEDGATEILCILQARDGQLVLNIYNNAAQLFDKPVKLMEDLAIRERLKSIEASSEMHRSQEGQCFIISIPYNAPATQEDPVCF